MSIAYTEFLSSDEARRAIVCDLRSYGPQIELVCALFQALGQERTRPFARDGHRGVMLACAGSGEEFVPVEAAQQRIETLLEALRPPPQELARLCALVFGAPARVAVGPDGKTQGVLLDTGMEDFVCTRCGRCCLELEFHYECTEQDVALWRQKGRDDILAWVGQEDGPDGQQYRIWKRPGTPLYAESCPFLRRVPGDTACLCTINDVKPAVCRSYPGLRKHAIMTGCRGGPRGENHDASS